MEQVQNETARVQGWCPGAWRPMPSGDGLVLRARPPLGRLTAAQCLRLARLAASHGAGVVELSSRANVQLRGLADARHATVLRALAGAGLLDADAALERRRNVVIDPLWRAGDGVLALAQRLQAAIAQAPGLADLPAKFGWAVVRNAQGLQEWPADVRLLPAAPGSAASPEGRPAAWWVQPDGQPWALAAATAEDAVATAIALAQWCAAQAQALRQQGQRPMRLRALLAAWQAAQPPALAAMQAAQQTAQKNTQEAAPKTASPWPSMPPWPLPAGVWRCALPAAGPSAPPLPPAPGWLPGLGWLAAAPLGRISARALARLAGALHEAPGAVPGAPLLRITPWRMVLIEMAQKPDTHWLQAAGLLDAQQWLTGADDARLRVSACPGAPACHQALTPTQALALALAEHVPPGAHLHISGCPKGCARQQPATVTLYATPPEARGGCAAPPLFALVRNGACHDRPSAYWSAQALHEPPALVAARLFAQP